jgi:PAS domain S-box-containing protein
MTPLTKTLALALGLGLFLWLSDALLAHFIFNKGSFVDLLILDVPRQELYTRILALICVIIFGLISGRILALQKETARKLDAALDFPQQLINSSPVPIFYQDINYLYTGCNSSFTDFFGFSNEDLIRKNIHDLVPKEIADIFQEVDVEQSEKPLVQIYEFDVQHFSKGKRHVIFHKATFHNPEGKVTGLIGTMLDITERTEAEKKKETLALELKEALDKIKTLSSFLPICSSCNKVRGDHGQKNQIEEYIQKHPDTKLSHTTCPDCMRKLYPDFAEEMAAK